METPKAPDTAHGEMTHIGRSVVIKGELSCSEELYIDGQVDGAIDPKENRLTIGPHGRLKASVKACAVVVQRKLEGDISANDRVDLKQAAIVPSMKARISREMSTSRKKHPREKYRVSLLFPRTERALSGVEERGVWAFLSGFRKPQCPTKKRLRVVIAGRDDIPLFRSRIVGRSKVTVFWPNLLLTHHCFSRSRAA